MKKLFGIALLSLFVLAACGGSDTDTDANNDVVDVVICSDDIMTLTLYSDEGVITSMTIENIEDTSEMSEAEINLAIAVFEGLGGSYEMDGDYLTLRLELDADEAAEFLDIDIANVSLDEIIAEAEADGAVCN